MKKRPTSAAGDSQPVVTSLRQKILLIAFGLALFFLGLWLVEGLLAVFGLGDRHLYEDPFVGFDPGQELFSEKTLADGRRVFATNPSKLSFFNAQEFAAEKPAGSYRVFGLGGSTTAGRPYDSRVAFPHWMQLYLQAMDPSRTYEVVNAGAISYASYRIVLLMKELVRYQPDLFVIYTGHNEFLEERTYSDIIHQDPAVQRLRMWLGRLRLFTVVRQGWESVTDPAPAVSTLAGEVEAALDSWAGLDLYHRDDELRSSIVEHFEYNLHQMVAIARDHGAEVVFVSPVSNLKDFSPFKSEHSASLSREQRAEIAEILAQGRSLLASDQPTEATRAFEQALALDPEYAESHFRLAQGLLQGGQPEAAKAAFERARDLDVAPLRALGVLEDRLRSVAAEHGIPLVDLPGILEADSRERYGHGVIGNEYLLDHVHPDFPVHGLVAERVIDVLVERRVVRPASDWSEAKKQQVQDDLEASIDREYYAQRDHNLGKVLTWAGKLEEAEAPLMRASQVLTDNPEVWLNQGILFEKTGRRDQAVQALRRAIALAPDAAEAHFNLGTNLGYLGRTAEGIEAIEEAIRLQPDLPLAHFNLGILHRQDGRYEDALRAFERARELQPDAPEIARNVALVYRLQGRTDEAITAFRGALAKNPEDAAAITGVGIALAQEGRLDAAADELRKAIELDPDHAEAHLQPGPGALRPAADRSGDRRLSADPGGRARPLRGQQQPRDPVRAPRTARGGGAGLESGDRDRSGVCPGPFQPRPGAARHRSPGRSGGGDGHCPRARSGERPHARHDRQPLRGPGPGATGGPPPPAGAAASGRRPAALTGEHEKAPVRRPGPSAPSQAAVSGARFLTSGDQKRKPTENRKVRGCWKSSASSAWPKSSPKT